MAIQRAARCIATLLVLLAPVFAPPLQAEDLFDRLYREGQARNGDLRSFTASFVEETTSTLLTRPLIARGRVAVERPARVALRYDSPDLRVVIIDGDTMTISWPSRSVQQARDVGAALSRVRRYFVEGSPAELRRHFQVTASATADRPGYLVTLVPTRKQIREGLSRLDLWIAPDTLLMSAMRMMFPGGDTKLMTFTDVRPNAPVQGMFEPGK